MNKKDLPRSSTMWKNNLAPSGGPGWPEGWAELVDAMPEDQSGKANSPRPLYQPGGILPAIGIRFLLAIHSAWDDKACTQIQCTIRWNPPLGIVAFLNHAGDGPGHQFSPEVLYHGVDKPSGRLLIHWICKIKQGALGCFTLPVVKEVAADRSPPPFFLLFFAWFSAW